MLLWCDVSGLTKHARLCVPFALLMTCCAYVWSQLAAGSERLIVDVGEARNRRRTTLRRNRALRLRVETFDKEIKLRRSQLGQCFAHFAMFGRLALTVVWHAAGLERALQVLSRELGDSSSYGDVALANSALASTQITDQITFVRDRYNEAKRLLSQTEVCVFVPTHLACN